MKTLHLLITAFLACPLMLPASSYRDTVLKTAGMTHDEQTRSLASKFGLDVLNVTWEDTGRFKSSAVGPNISDMTIQVAVEHENSDARSVHCMPVIRFPNFSDKTADLDPREFTLLVGNEDGQPLKRVSLYEFLENPASYMSDPKSWGGNKPKTLLAPKRDSAVLVSAQACFLPIPKKGKATFNPVLFNYQSSASNPAVLTILATREGTSMTIIDNTRDAFEEGGAWGQRLFFNENGQRASLTGERQSDFIAANPEADPGKGPSATEESGLNMVLLIQVPLKHKPLPSSPMADYFALELAAPAGAKMMREESDVENAVIGHGELEGPFTEIDHQPIERDPKFPVRVTVQFYKATSNGVVSKADLTDIKDQIGRVYAQSDYVGSLVTAGETGRVTEYEGVKVQPPDWWKEFWKRHEKNTGDSRDEAIRKLIELLGEDYHERPVCGLYLNDLLASAPAAAEAQAEKPAKRGFFSRLFGGA